MIGQKIVHFEEEDHSTELHDVVNLRVQNFAEMPDAVTNSDGSVTAPIQMFKYGFYKKGQQVFLFNDKSFDEMISNQARYTRPPIHFGHPDDVNATPRKGWVDNLFKIPGKGLYGMVTLLKDAVQAINEKTYEFFSPSFYPGTARDEQGNPIGYAVTGGGLVQVPFLNGMDPVQTNFPADSMLFAVGFQESPVKSKPNKAPSGQKGREGDMEITKEMLATVGLPPDATEAQFNEALKKRSADSAKLSEVEKKQEATQAEIKTLKEQDTLRASESMEMGCKAFLQANVGKKFLPRQVDGFAEAATDENQYPATKVVMSNWGSLANAQSFVESAPDLGLLSQAGSGGGTLTPSGDDKSAFAEADKTAKARAKEEKISYADALVAVLSEDADLNKRYEHEEAAQPLQG